MPRSSGALASNAPNSLGFLRCRAGSRPPPGGRRTAKDKDFRWKVNAVRPTHEGRANRSSCRALLARVRVRRVLLRLADPAHHVAELLPHLLDGVRRLLLAERLEPDAAGLVLLDELLRELARLDL